jgi:hypothetical protein
VHTIQIRRKRDKIIYIRLQDRKSLLVHDKSTAEMELLSEIENFFCSTPQNVQRPFVAYVLKIEKFCPGGGA